MKTKSPGNNKKRKSWKNGKNRESDGQDSRVMATNSSSIVSKRSVEKIYYPNEPHFFRFFTKRFQRRSPLINRGYHLRLHLIDRVVRDFLGKPCPSGRPKVVVNLGCGSAIPHWNESGPPTLHSDVLPWQCLSRYPLLCQSAKFVDVDFPDLVLRKRAIVLQTPELRDCFAPMEVVDGGPLLLRSPRYFQVGCNLRDITGFDKALSTVIDLSACSVLCIAEVSITYMETKAANAIIQWAASLADAAFCLLEQILPDGPDHPFASTMLRHFEKLNSPLMSARQYPTVQSQVARFSDLGWPDIRCWTLWEAWAAARFFSADMRRRLDEVEPFDEWEEFALFGAHYVILCAQTSCPLNGAQPDLHGKDHGKEAGEMPVALSLPLSLPHALPPVEMHVGFRKNDRSQAARRFGAAMSLSSILGKHVVVADVLGTGTGGRLRSMNLYTPSRGRQDVPQFAQTETDGCPAARVCHALTDLGACGFFLLSGGRSSPATPLADSWLFAKGEGRWQRAQSLPVPLYRHAAASLGGSGLALLFGGKTGPSDIFDGYLIYSPDMGYTKCCVSGPTKPVPVFGATAYCWSHPRSTRFKGLLAGGLRADGTIAEQLVCWELDMADPERPTLYFTDCTHTDGEGLPPHHRRVLARFGASCVSAGSNRLLVAGGVIRDHILPQDHDFLLVRDTWALCGRLFNPALLDGKCNSLPRPLLIGSSLLSVGPGVVVAVGGGATCYAMGSFWNEGAYTLTTDYAAESEAQEQPGGDPAWEYVETVAFAEAEKTGKADELEQADELEAEEAREMASMEKLAPCLLSV